MDGTRKGKEYESYISSWSPMIQNCTGRLEGKGDREEN